MLTSNYKINRHKLVRGTKTQCLAKLGSLGDVISWARNQTAIAVLIVFAIRPNKYRWWYLMQSKKYFSWSNERSDPSVIHRKREIQSGFLSEDDWDRKGVILAVAQPFSFNYDREAGTKVNSRGNAKNFINSLTLMELPHSWYIIF